MRRSWIGAGLVLALACAVAACEVREEEGPRLEQVPPGTAAYDVGSATGPGSPASRRIQVVNPLQRPLELRVRYDGTDEALGAVAARSTGDFFLQAPEGVRVQLIATDEAGAVVADTSFAAAAASVTWTPDGS